MNLYDNSGRPYTPGERNSGITIVDDERKVAEKTMHIFNRCSANYSKLHKIHRQCLDFISDRQWSESDYRHFRKLRRIPLTINITKPYAMHVAGLQRSTRREVTLAPVDNITDPDTAKIAQSVLSHVNANSHIETQDALVFMDGECGIGHYGVREDYLDNPLGEVYLERLNPFCAMYDYESIDPFMTDMKYQIRWLHMTPDDLRNHPKWGPTVKRRLNFSKEEYEDWWMDLTDMMPMYDGEINNIANQKNGLYAVMILEERVVKPEYAVLDATGDYVMPFTKDSSYIKDYMDATGYLVLPHRANFFRKTVVLPYGYVVLSQTMHRRSHFTMTPFLSHRFGQKIPDCTSYINSMVGLQRELNIRRSNVQEAVIRSIRGGFWIFGEGHKGEKLLEKINSEGHKIGQSYIVEGENAPQPITPANIISHLHFLEEGAEKYFEMVTGFSVQPYGGQSGSESGIHRAQRKEESETTILDVIEAHNAARAQASDAALERKILITNIPTMLRITGDKGTPEFVELSEELLANLKRTRKFDIKVTETPFALQKKLDDFDLYLMLEERTIKNGNGDLIDEGERFRRSPMEDGRELGDTISKRQQAKTDAMMKGGIAERTRQDVPAKTG